MDFHPQDKEDKPEFQKEANNIPSTITADDEGGLAPYPLQPSPTGAKLLVNQKDFTAAARLLK